MNAVRLLARQVRFTNRGFWRNAAAAGFTVGFPLVLLAVLAVAFDGGGSVTAASGADVSLRSFYVAGIAVFGLVSACFTNVAMTTVFQREEGVLKRVRGTPLQPRIYLGARILHAAGIGLALVAVTLAVGAAAYGLELPARSIPGVAVASLVGAATFAALGLAVTTAIPSAPAASPIVNATVLPLLFVSNVFVPLEDPPRWLDLLTSLFPVRHLADAIQAALFSPGPGIGWGSLAALLAWGAAASIVASRTFRWEPPS
jgi:ABC-2 type transport system permease protein